MIIKHYKNRNYIISTSLKGGNYALLKELPGHTKWIDRDLMFRPTGANIKYIMEHWPEAEWQGDALGIKDELLAAELAAEEMRSIKHIEQSDDGSYQYAREPMDHQRQAFLLSRDLPAFGLFMEQGTGKTKVTIDKACWLFQKKEIDCLVVIAWPNGVHRNWTENEIPEDVPDWCNYKSAWWNPNLTQARVKEYEAVLATGDDTLKIFTFNVEAFASQKAKDWILRILTENRCMLVIDQSASIKNPTAKRTKFIIRKCAPLAPHRMILDGAPVAESAVELYSQFLFLDPFIIGHDTLTAFKAEFCKIGYFKDVVGYKNLPELHKRIDGYCYRVLEKDCLDLPQRRYKRWTFELTKEERRIYNEMNSKKLAYFNENERENPLEADLAIVKSLRLQQISAGWWPQIGDFKPIGETSSRLAALTTLLSQLDGKVLIFSRFRADLEAMQNHLGDAAVSYHGGINSDDRELAKKKFMTDDSTQYFIGQPRNAGIGHTLTAAKHVVFYNNDPSLRFREESEKRAHRKGLEDTIEEGGHLMIWDLVAGDTQDNNIINALRAKKDLATLVLQDPESLFLIEDHD